MPTVAQIEQAMRTHFSAWNRRDRDAWLRNFAEDAVLEDPVGGPRKRGREALEKSWERSFQDDQDWRIEPLFQCICADEAAHLVRSTGMVHGRKIVVEGIEVYTIDDAGRIARVRTWFRAPGGEQLDPYFSPAPEASPR